MGHRIEAAAWVIFVAGLLAATARAAQEARAQREGRWLAGVIAIALGVRLAIPWTTTHWYYTGGNVLGAPGVYHHATAAVPWIDRLVGFELGWADVGLGWTHLAASLVGIVMVWSALSAGGASLAVKALTTLGFALTPMYVRYAVTDSSHLWAWVAFTAAAAALGRAVHRGETAIDDVAIAVLAPVLGAPIRLESAPLLAAAILWAPVVKPVPVRAIARRPLSVIFALACAAGVALAVAAHRADAASRLRFDPGSVIFGLLVRVVLALPSWPWPVSFFPLALTVLYWVILVRRARDRAWTRLAWMAAAACVCAAPFLFTGALFFELGGAGYSLVALSFLVLWAAEGADEVLRRVATTPARRRAVAAAFAVVLVTTFVPGWTRTFAFMEETRFLRRALANRRGVVLALSDPQGERCGHDPDATVALPDALLSVREPALRWLVVRSDGADAFDPEGASFDYYYRGGDLELDPASMEGRFQRLVNGDPASRRCHAERLARLRRLDERIRARFPLRVVARETVTARTFSFIAFPGDRETLTLYERP
jgi:hypothetical protein